MGEVPYSQDVVAAAVLSMALLWLGAQGPLVLARLKEICDVAFGAVRGDLTESLASIMASCAMLMATAVLPLMVALFAAGLAGGFLQVRRLTAPAPSASRAGRAKGAQRAHALFSGWRVADLFVACAKLGLLGLVAFATLRSEMRGVVGLLQRSPEQSLSLVAELAWVLLARLCATLAGIAVLDVLYRHYRHRQALKMTRDEMEREFREAEGHPQLKRRRQRIHREIAALEHRTD